MCLVTSTDSTCVTSKYSVLYTTSILILSHCVWRLTRTVPLSPSHRVVYLARTVLLSSVLLLPGLSLTQCTSVTPVTVQDYNSVYTRVCIHTVFSCQVCLRKTGASLSVKITVVLRELWVTDSSTQSSRAKVTTSTISFELSLESTSGQSTYHVCVRWPTCQLADQSASQTLNSANTSRPRKTQHVPSWAHPPVLSRLDVTYLSLRQG